MSRGGLCQGHRVICGGTGVCEGCGRPGGRGRGVREPREFVSFAGGYSKAIEYHAKHLAIAKEVDNRAKEVQAYGNFGTVHFYLIEYVKDLAYQKERHALYTTDLRAFLQP